MYMSESNKNNSLLPPPHILKIIKSLKRAKYSANNYNQNKLNKDYLSNRQKVLEKLLIEDPTNKNVKDELDYIIKRLKKRQSK